MVKSKLEKEPTLREEFNNFMSSLATYGIIFVVLTFNLCAVSVSLHMNYGKEFNRKIGGAIFAFFFGPIYLYFNYYMYRILRKGEYRPTTSGKIFPWY